MQFDEQSTIDSRRGAVLARGTILKAEHHQQQSAQGQRMLCVMGAPNWRIGPLGICGTAQPNESGLLSVLQYLRLSSSSDDGGHARRSVVWFSAREEPIIYINSKPYVLRDHSAPLENIKSFAGISGHRLELIEERLREDILAEAPNMLLVHAEFGDAVVPCWVAVESVETPRELFGRLCSGRFPRFRYCRVPVSRWQNPTDSYIDEYVREWRSIGREDVVIFSCGMGVGRTTFGMVLGCLLRGEAVAGGAVDDPTLRLLSAMEEAFASAPHTGRESATQWVIKRPRLREPLRQAIQGNYHVVAELTRVLPHGPACKSTVDQAIDANSTLINLREQVLIHRMRHMVTGQEEALEDALRSLERYFCLIVFAAYIGDTAASAGRGSASDDSSFRRWIQGRSEVWGLFVSLRARRGQFKPFRPIDDLATGRPSTRLSVLGPGQEMEQQCLGPADPVAVVHGRAGAVLTGNTILKLDHWTRHEAALEGAPNFRRAIDGLPVWALAQPVLATVPSILDRVALSSGGPGGDIVWFNVREEPLVYINGHPYVLRDQYATLRNIKAYSGITSGRLEMMEERLREDILAEVAAFDGQLLVHEEDAQGRLQTRWIDANAVETPRGAFSAFQQRCRYVRLPVTAEDSFEARDFDRMREQSGSGSIYIINDQMGAGRSTMGAIIAAQLVLHRQHGSAGAAGGAEGECRLMSYRVVHSLLRLLRSGRECKQAVDSLIGAAASVVHLRDTIEECRQQAVANSATAYAAIRRGVANLKRYVMLILFQAHLLCAAEGDASSFEEWLRAHMEIGNLLAQVDSRDHGLDSIVPSAGAISESEVWHVVKGRRGSILATMTILKDDHFPGCQRESLAERVPGAPNFRQAATRAVRLFGAAMPTREAIPRVVARIGGPRLVWICLREEPVVFVEGHPYVLRVVRDPVTNLEMTGIVSERVEQMEERLKADCLLEAREHGGLLLVHNELDEGEEGAGPVTLPAWLPGRSACTPREAFSAVSISYHRIPITDEQAPIPSTFDAILDVLRTGPDDAAYVCSCQMGRGRTTTCMVVILLARSVASGGDGAHGPGDSDHLRRGEFRLVLALQRVLPHGREAKAHVDRAIDACEQVQNLRSCIIDHREHEHERARNYLIRYFYLVAFGEYLLEDGSRPFATWLQGRPEVTNLLSHWQAKPSADFFS